MGLIKSKGAPRKTTKGAIDDTYIDIETGKCYKCVSIYIDSLGTDEYEWQYVDVDETFSVKNESKDDDTVDTPDEQVVVPTQESQNREWPRDNNRKQYNKHYNKHYNQNNN